MTERHFAWFRGDAGSWIGEWCGRVPAPVLPQSVIGDARLMLLNEWVQQTQARITPFGSPYAMIDQAWSREAWDACPAGGAVCLDVTMYRWPVGDFTWAVFDGVDRLLDFRDMHAFLQLSPATAMIDVNSQSPRQIRSTPSKLIADITGTALEPFAGRLFGRLARRDGRIVFEPSSPGLPEAVVLSITDRNEDMAMLRAVDPAAIPEHATLST